MEVPPKPGSMENALVGTASQRSSPMPTPPPDVNGTLGKLIKMACNDDQDEAKKRVLQEHLQRLLSPATVVKPTKAPDLIRLAATANITQQHLSAATNQLNNYKMASREGREICSIRSTKDVAIELVLKVWAIFETYRARQSRRERRRLWGASARIEGATTTQERTTPPSPSPVGLLHDPRFAALREVGSATKRSPLSIISETESGQGPTVHAMIASGADVNGTDPGPARRTPLHAAAFNDRAGNIDALVAAGAETGAECQETGETPLHVAAGRYKRKAAEALLRCGATVNALDREGRTALHLVVATITSGTAKLVQCLLVAGADENIKDDAGKTALEYVLRKSPHQTGKIRKEVQLLLQNPKWAAGRAWRRRAFIVMGRARLQEDQSSSSNSDSKQSKLEEPDQRCVADDGRGPEAAVQGGRVVDEWKDMVEWVWGLKAEDEEEERVFRNIVSFL